MQVDGRQARKKQNLHHQPFGARSAGLTVLVGLFSLVLSDRHDRDRQLLRIGDPQR
jgi:hypothetical protein